MTNRITIKVQNRDEGRVIITKIFHLTALPANTGTEVSFVLNPGVAIMDVAKLLKSAPIEFGGPRHNAPVVKSVDCNLATHIAWLEGLSVVSECTGKDYCEVIYVGVKSGRVRYDPIGRGSILLRLIEKYCVDLNWRTAGCVVNIYTENRSHAYAETKDHNGCLATTVLTAILKVNKYD